jgi:ferritin-like metal-binding protein YciE
MYSNLHALLDEQLQEIYSAEHELARRLPLIGDGAGSSELKHALLGHAEQTEKQLDMLEHILRARGLPLRGRNHRAIDALIRQALELFERRGNETSMDLGLIFIMRHIEDLERGSYEIARSIAEVLEASDLVKTLDRLRNEEDQMERTLTVLGDDMMDTVVAEMSSKRGESLLGEGSIRV